MSAGGFALWQLLRAPSGASRRPIRRRSPAGARRDRGDSRAARRKMALMGDKALMFSASGPSLPDVRQTREKLDRALRSRRTARGMGANWSSASSGSPPSMAGGPTSTRRAPKACRSISTSASTRRSSARRRSCDLDGFTLKGGDSSHLRYALKRGERDGLAFEWLSPEAAAARLDELAPSPRDGWRPGAARRKAFRSRLSSRASSRIRALGWSASTDVPSPSRP